MNPYDIIYNEKLGELLKDVLFPRTQIPDGFRRFVGEAISRCTYIDLQCSLEEYKRVYEYALTAANNPVECDCLLPEMFVALNAAMRVPAYKIGGSIDEYIKLNERFNEMHGKWQEIAAPYMEQARKFAEDKAKRDQRELQAKSKLVQLNGKSFK